MKLVLILLFAGIFAQAAFAAESPTQLLVCSEGPHEQGTVRVTLDSSGFDPGSGYEEATSATLYYEFSSVQKMVCDGYVHNSDYDIECVGLYAGAREVTIIKLKSEGQKVFAYWQTSRPYGNKNKKTECKLQ